MGTGTPAAIVGLNHNEWNGIRTIPLSGYLLGRGCRSANVISMESIEMTAEELQRLRTELGELESSGRSEIAARIKTAREWGDLKENGEYHAAKEAQAHLETRILRMREQLRAAVVVQREKGDDIQHGATVEVTDLRNDARQRFKIVSPNDAKPKEGLLSSSSPVAQALMGHRLGEVVEIEIPAGVRRLRIESIG